MGSHIVNKRAVTAGEDSKIEILLVEDSRTYQSMITGQLEEVFNANITSCESYEELLDAVVTDKTYDIALTDLNVPGAPKGEALDELLSRKIPTIVFTGTFSEEVREKLIKRNVVDYVLKDGPDAVNVMVRTTQRMLNNSSTKILVVDDQRTTQAIMVNLLQRQLYDVQSVLSAEEAVAWLEAGHRFDLMITDYNMPGMNGDELSAFIRRNHEYDKMRILGVSSTGNSLMSAQFLKSGANDFMQRPFAAEEFQWRVSQNIETGRLVSQLDEMANRDFLTGLHNRRYLFSYGQSALENAYANNQPASFIMFDLDHFKQFNDNYGYVVGDEVLTNIANLLHEHVASDHLCVRIGGEEFGIVLPNVALDEAASFAENLRELIEKTGVTVKGRKVKVTASFGVSQFNNGDLIDTAFVSADNNLHEAKNAGRNNVVAKAAPKSKRRLA